MYISLPNYDGQFNATSYLKYNMLDDTIHYTEATSETYCRYVLYNCQLRIGFSKM